LNFVSEIFDSVAYGRGRVAEVFDNYSGMLFLVWLGRTVKSHHVNLLKTTITMSDSVFRVGYEIDELDRHSGGDYYFHFYEIEESVILRSYGRLLASYFTNIRCIASIVFNASAVTKGLFFEFVLDCYAKVLRLQYLVFYTKYRCYKSMLSVKFFSMAMEVNKV
jgi:hypothetical protein